MPDQDPFAALASKYGVKVDLASAPAANGPNPITVDGKEHALDLTALAKAHGAVEGGLVPPTLDVSKIDPSIKTLIVRLPKGQGAVLIPKIGDDHASVNAWRSTGDHLGVYQTPEAAAAFVRTLKSQPSEGGLSDLGSGFLATQPIHPLALGQTAIDAVAGPIQALHGTATGQMGPGEALMTATTAPRSLADGIWRPMWETAQAAHDTIKLANDAALKGDVIGAVSNYLAGLTKAIESVIPVVGPMASHAGDEGQNGHYAKMIGESLGAAATLVTMGVPKILALLGSNKLQAMAETPALGQTQGSPAMAQGQIVQGPQKMGGVTPGPPGAVPPPTPQAAADIRQFASDRNVPIPADVATGNRVLRGLRGANAGSSFGASLAEDGQLGQFAGAMEHAGGQIAHEISPGGAPEATVAGPTGADALQSLAGSYRTSANTSYGKVRELLRDPARAETVRVPMTGQIGGETATIQAPVSMQVPVNLKALKAGKLGELYREMRDLWPEARKASSPAWPAIRNIMDGPDVMEAELLDKNLSGLKSIAREQGGVAKLAVAEVEQALQVKLDSLGDPEIKSLLGTGRSATKAYHALEDVAEKLGASKSNEPYGVLRLDDIMALKKAAPEALPIVARAWLQTLLNRAFEVPGTFQHAAKLYGDWGRINNRVKFETFGPERVKEITAFFRTAAEVERTENSSKTAHVMALVSKGTRTAAAIGGVFWHPMATALEAGTELTQWQLAKLLWNPKTAQLLTRGLTTPRASTGVAKGLAAEIANAARAAGAVSQLAHADVTTIPQAADREQPQQIGPYTVRSLGPGPLANQPGAGPNGVR